MNGESDLASLLNKHMNRASVGDARLATIVNSLVDNQHFIHRSTIRNWRSGAAQTVNNSRQLAMVAAALRLSEEEASELLESGGCPPIGVLAVSSKEADQKLLKFWRADASPSTATNGTDHGIDNGIETGSVRSLHADPAAEIDTHGLNDPSRGARPGRAGWKRIGIATVLVTALLSAYLIYSFNAPPTQAGNLLLNSNFEQGTKEWLSFVHDDADASFSIENDALRIQINQIGSKHWHIQLFQQNIDIQADQRYTLKFRVRGDENTSMKVDVTRAVDPKTTLGFGDSIRQNVNPTREWSDVTITFKANQSMSIAAGGARVLFDIGRSAPGWLLLDDVEFYKETP